MYCSCAGIKIHYINIFTESDRCANALWAFVFNYVTDYENFLNVYSLS